MVIYVDFDDVICETARALSRLADQLFERKVPYDAIHYFELEKSFSLSSGQLEQLMDYAHTDDFLLNLELTAGADTALRLLLDRGHDVQIVTGRPSFCHEGTMQWLENHALSDLPIVYVDKYGRGQHGRTSAAPPLLSLTEFNALHYDVAIDDSPIALDILSARTQCRTFIFHRPWNQNYTRASMRRVMSWPEIACCLTSSIF